MTKYKVYEESAIYLERIRKLIGEELWDKVYEELKNGRAVQHENMSALRNSL